MPEHSNAQQPTSKMQLKIEEEDIVPKPQASVDQKSQIHDK